MYKENKISVFKSEACCQYLCKRYEKSTLATSVKYADRVGRMGKSAVTVQRN
jgi:hypothetical protein